MAGIVGTIVTVKDYLSPKEVKLGADCFMGTNERFFIHKLPVVSTPFEKVLLNLQS